jgi:ATP-binding cassette, subfamily G (WHITE), member 2, PDR
LADHGQAILCTIHQPSAQLFSEFDRLLFLAEGGHVKLVITSRLLITDYKQEGAQFISVTSEKIQDR